MNARLVAVCGLIALVIVSARSMISGSEDETQGQFVEYVRAVRAIDTYELFQKALGTITEPVHISSKENYELFVRIAAKEMKSVFTPEEMQQIVEFYQSPLGRKLSRYKMESKAFDTFLDTVSPSEAWSCDNHPQILTSNPGTCPICERDLVKKRLIGGK